MELEVLGEQLLETFMSDLTTSRTLVSVRVFRGCSFFLKEKDKPQPRNTTNLRLSMAIAERFNHGRAVELSSSLASIPAQKLRRALGPQACSLLSLGEGLRMRA